MSLVRGDHTIVVIDGDGRRITYAPKDPPTGDFDEFSLEWDSTASKGDFSNVRMVKQMNHGLERLYYVLIRPAENRQYLFEAATGKLAEIRDAFNNVATLEYEEYGGTRGELIEVRDNQGFVVRFGNDGIGNLTVTDTAGNSAKISNRGIVSPLGVYSYHLNDKGYITDFTNADTGQYIINSKLGIVQEVSRISDGRKMSFSHDFNKSRCSYQYYSKLGDIPRTWNQIYDDRGIWTQITSGDGQTLTQAISKDFTSVTTTNRYGGTSSTTFDKQTGLPTDYVDPDGRIFKKRYGGQPNPNYCVDGSQGKSYNYLDKINQVAQKIDGKGNSTRYDYSGGRLAVIAESPATVSGGGSAAATTVIDLWDVYQQPMLVNGPRAGYTKTYVYDALGNLVSVNELGAGVSAITKYKTDVWGRPTTITLPDGRVVYKSHDVAGRETQSIGPVVLSDPHNHRTGSPNGGETDAWYDNSGRVILARDVDGRTVERHYNELGALEQIISSASGTTTFSNFDALMLPKTTTLSTGVVVTHTYDYHGHESQRVYPNVPGYVLPGGTTVASQACVYNFAYNDIARTVTTTDPLGHIVTRSLYPSGRSRSVVGDLGLSVQYEYDNNGDTTAVIVPGEGKHTTELDQHGIIAHEGIEGVSLDTTYQRDPLGTVLDKEVPGGIHLSQMIDSVGRAMGSGINGTALSQRNYNNADADFQFVPTSIIDQESGGTTTTQKIDVGSRVANVTVNETRPFGTGFNAAQGFPMLPESVSTTRTFSYLLSGKPWVQTDGNGGSVAHMYDAALREVKVADQNGLGASTTYDTSGRVSSTTDDRGKVTSYIYNSTTGWLATKQLPGDRQIQFSYDANGNVVLESHLLHPGAVDGTKQTYVIKHTYDALNREICTTDPAGHTTTTTYTASGRTATVTNPDSHTTTYRYDAAGRTIGTSISPGGLTTSTTYAPNGKVASVRHSDGRVETTTYDDRGRISTLTKTGEGTLTYAYSQGDLVSITDSNNHVTQMTYDSMHRLVSTTSADGQVTLHGYDAGGFLTRLTDPKGQEFGYLNYANGRRQTLSRINLDRTTTVLGSFTYDGNTPTSDGSVSWLLDDAGRVASVGGANASVTYAYEHPLGLMTRKTYGATNTQLQYGYDTAGYLQAISDNHFNSVSYERSPGGLVNAAQYSSGIDVSYSYTLQQFIQVSPIEIRTIRFWRHLRRMLMIKGGGIVWVFSRRMNILHINMTTSSV